MASCQFYDLCRDEENDALDGDCLTNEHLGKGCYQGFVQIAYSLGDRVVPELPGVNTQINPFNN